MAPTEPAQHNQTTVDGPAGTIEVKENGQGPPVVLIPSLGRGASDFDLLSSRLAAAGYHAIAPEPRGIGNSTGELSGLTIGDRASMVMVPDAGHALLPEQPAAVADAVLGWLAERNTTEQER